MLVIIVIGSFAPKYTKRGSMYALHFFFLLLECIYYQYLHILCFSFLFFLDGNNGEIEKSPFIAKPVRLTPAWEANNLPNDELNFRGVHCIFASFDSMLDIKMK